MTSLFEHTVTEHQPVKVEMIAEGKVGARLATFKNGVQAVMKLAEDRSPKKGKKQSYGIPVSTLPYREVAFYQLNKLCDFDVVPETVLSHYKGVPASYQQWIQATKLYEIDKRLMNLDDEDTWVVAFRETMRSFPMNDALQLAVLDVLACSRDRHGANLGARLAIESGKARWRLFGWDNGASFSTKFTRYHNVVHKYIFRFAFDLSPVWQKLNDLRQGAMDEALSGLLSDEEIEHTWLRLQFMREYPYKLPWSVFSQGAESPNDFPSYADYFKPLAATTPVRFVLAHSRG